MGKKKLGQKDVWVKKNIWALEKFWAKKNLLGLKINGKKKLGQKDFGPKRKGERYMTRC